MSLSGNQIVIEGNMEIRLKRIWKGHLAGTIVKVSESCANILFQRDEAEKMEPESKDQIRKRLQAVMAKNLLKSSLNN